VRARGAAALRSAAWPIASLQGSLMAAKLFSELLCISCRSNLTVIQWHLAARLVLFYGVHFGEFALFGLPTECAVMPFLRILCPIKKQSFATSVETSIEHKSSLPNILKFSYCPYCNALHGWSPDEAFFDDTEYQAFLSEASAASAGSNVTNVPRRRKEKPQQSTVGGDRKRTSRGRLRSITV